MATLLAGLSCLFATCAPVSAQQNSTWESKSGAVSGEPALRPAAPPLPQDAGSLASVAGRRVHDIQFRGTPSIVPTSRWLSLIPQKVDQPLDKRKVRASVQALFATGRFQDIQVAVEPAPNNEVSLLFIARENQFVGSVDVALLLRHGPTSHQLVNASKLQLGELLTDARMEQAIAGIEKVLEENGFYRATVTPQLTPHPKTQQADILFNIQAGPRASVGKIKVTGDPGLTLEQISELTKLRRGDPVTAQVVTRALQRLRKEYQKQDRLEAQASLVSRAYRPESNTVDYTLNIVRGPLVAIHVEGARLPGKVIKRSVPVYEESAVDDDLLNEGRRNLRDYLQTQGYFESQVNVVRKEQPGLDRTDIVFDVDKGERYKLAAVALEGNKYFPTDLIRDRMQIQPAGWLLEHGLFSQSLLNRDLDSIRDLYRSNGFLQVNAYAEVQDDYLGRKGQMRVLVHIREGPQTLVKDLTIVGATTFADMALRNMLANVPGQPFSDANMAADRDALANFYFNRGFPEVTVTYAAHSAAEDPTRMNVTYTIREGERVYVNQVLVSGLNYTRPSVVEKRIVPHAGDPLSQADMLKTQSRLYDLGIFSAVDVAVQNPDGKEAYKDVLLNLSEARRYTFNYGLGFEVQSGGTPAGVTNPQGRTGASPRVSFDVSRLNFRGRDETIYLQSHFGRLQQRALLGYAVPHWLDREKLKLTFNLLYDNTLDVFTFTSQRVEGSMQVQQSVSKATTLLYRLTYRDVRVSNLAITPALIPQLSQPVRIGIPSFTYIRDTRDNPVDSHKGNYLVFDTGVTSHALGSQTNFGRFLLQHSEYRAFGHKGRFVLAHSTQLGIEQPWGGSSATVPLAERFYSGGGNSLRGFATNQAGPRDLGTGYQLGGEALFVNNLELRLPPVPLPFLGKDLSPVIFHDMGNVFASPSDLFPSLFRWSQPNLTECKNNPSPATCNPIFNYNSHAVGGGIRYRTPIGPVRFDVSYNLNPPTYLVGFQSPQPPAFQVLHRVNFFFSIGQTF
ncbi:MAG TPA: POTRA domain-containing protein [Terriglobales bacterium]|jgi:outer membrane protein assembly complex protein YaeT|nr:POTRA domain-containing protein [Terriglobales bacterium]